VRFAERRTPVVVDLARSIAGGDSVTGIEGAEGTPGNDRLMGDDGPNRFSGGDGDDVILGRGGNDDLDGEKGSDRLVGGAGNDVLLGERSDGGDGNDHFADARSVRCGAGEDDVFGPPPAMPIRPDCEKIVPTHGLFGIDVDVERPHLGRSLSLTIHRDELSGADRVRITVKAKSRVIGRHTSHLGAVRHRVTIPLSRRASDVQIVFRTRSARTEFRFRSERPRAGTSARARPRPGGRRRSGP
jgi:hemolysin type calcium-binding protein